MSKTISGARMVRHIQRLTEALELLRKPHDKRAPEDIGRAIGLVISTRDLLLEDTAADVEVGL